MSDPCCQDPSPSTPEIHANLPGQPALRYRAGTHASFKAAMKAALGRQEALQDLTTREDDDFSIALLDASAVVLDVLTFYQERIANEGYLRTATERLSILELARSIGYELRPGVAASTYLAFELEPTPNAPPALTLPVGLKAQSIPGPDENPQTFETVEEIEARLEWNTLKPRTSRPFRPTPSTRDLVLQGTATNLKKGDALLVVSEERLSNPGSQKWALCRVDSIRVDAEKDLTALTLDRPLGWLEPHSPDSARKVARAYAMRTRAAVFGHNAPDWRMLPDELQGRFTSPAEVVKRIASKPIAQTQWPDFDLDTSSNKLDLDAVYDKILPESWVVLTSPTTRELARVTSVSEAARTNFGLTGKISQLAMEIHQFSRFTNSRRSLQVYGQSEELEIAESPLDQIKAGDPSGSLTLEKGTLPPLEGGEFVLDRVIPDFAPGRALAVSGQRMRARVLAAALELAAPNGEIKTVATGESLILTQSPLPLTNGLTRLLGEDKAGFQGAVDVTPAQVVLISAEPTDPAVSEVVYVEQSTFAPGERHTKIVLQQALLHSYDRATVVIQGNLAAATQGETRREVLGSADAARAFQRLTLKQFPVTHISADTPTGAASTLTIRINDLLWQETPSLYAQSPDQRVYTTRLDDDGKTSVQFGDGVNGARPPSGSENIVATYRVGSGAGGNVKSGQVSLLLSRPLGLKGVSNPLPATGGTDPETRDMARRNAPLNTLTLDRLVSLQDYEDFARSFAGIDKAQAAWLWDGGQRTVYLTVAGPDGQAVTAETMTFTNLSAAIQRYGLPYQPFQLASYTPLTFGVRARIQVDPSRTAELVLEDVRKVIADTFGFSSREFARGVAASQVLAAIQSVPGVTMADLDTLYLAGTTPSFKLPLPPLPAHPARRDPSGIIHPADLLTVDESKVELILVLE